LSRPQGSSFSTVTIQQKKKITSLVCGKTQEPMESAEEIQSMQPLPDSRLNALLFKNIALKPDNEASNLPLTTKNSPDVNFKASDISPRFQLLPENELIQKDLLDHLKQTSQANQLVQISETLVGPIMPDVATGSRFSL